MPSFAATKSKRITSRLRRKGRTAQSGIHLDYAIILRLRVESILHVTFTNDTDVADNLYCECTELVIFRVCKCLRRAITIDSPVWMPRGVKFSILQTVIQLS